MTIKTILNKKTRNAIFSIGSSATVYEALVLMADKNIGAVLVIDDGQLVGIFSERDYARKGILKGRTSQETHIHEVMTAKLLTVAPEQKIEDAMVIMSEKHIRHLPVIDGTELIGIISINDLVTAIISDQKNRIASLESYISGNPYA
ncbi:MAG: CBS domain-containing protein [Cytophagia bacterium]|nr:MAG: CBS domain-containing protein [Runella sp.]TAG17133.1 MAG: CBS domain-containing protein [Cytophagales bacterium]TAG36320.1 MAG: CBS domain-containing protein [Cytophagia bacterium]TAG50997.1 MAG: CBS domain-containing protein [Runella slithyformis]TAG67167.1 MAG: CBS domain-containing protein [Runella slithyformis]